jgi:dihydrofolate reductase
MITLIAACSSNRVIGKDNTLIWKIPGDLKRFKDLTIGNPILMGRKTFESIGKPLPNRTNIVLTRDKNWKMDGCLVYNHPDELLPLFEMDNLFIIGGGEIYNMFIRKADRIELTLIDKDFDGDTYFPEIGNEWTEVKRETLECPEFVYHYITYDLK